MVHSNAEKLTVFKILLFESEVTILNITPKDRRKAFSEWLGKQSKEDGEYYSPNTVISYASSLSTATGKLKGITLDTDNLYEIDSAETFNKIKELILGAVNFDDVNKAAGNRAFQYALDYYEKYLMQQQSTSVVGSLPQWTASRNNQSAEVGGINMDKNIILYGPPGTGKTYHTVMYAVAIIEKTPVELIEQEVETSGYANVLARYNTYKKNGQIEFTTFHQSYGYEEFIEGIKPSFGETSSDQSDDRLTYEIKAGIFKRFCEKALSPLIEDNNEIGIHRDATVWKVSLYGARENPIKRDCFNNNRIRIGWDEYGKEITEEVIFTRGGKQILNRFIEEMRIGDLILVLYDERTIDAVGVVTGEYEWLEGVENYRRSRSVKWLAKDIREDIYERNGNTVMTLGSVYRLNRIKISDVLDMVYKHNHSLLTSIKENPNRYVFIIDEINRGNISKVFGELITLIEPAKRIGELEEIKVQLPYSQTEFGVPGNVYLLGTMNTADRSIARIDTALRRRFQFIEKLPEPRYLENIEVEGVDLSRMLTIMNRRIEALYDREHTIGHAYFIPLTSESPFSSLSHIFRNAIIPLLQEYFYDDYGKIRMVLGDHNKNADEQFVMNKPIEAFELFGHASGYNLDQEGTFEINDKAFSLPEAFRKIYGA
jgi:5-methylcytosine-specific restriction protein B